MSAAELLCQIVGVKPQKFSREENILLEAELFLRLSAAMEKTFKEQHKDYSRLMKFDDQRECRMQEDSLVRCIINDILATREYTLSGIACYTQMPEEVISEVAIGRNNTPSAILLRRIIELHRTVRRELYREIMKKFAAEFIAVEGEGNQSFAKSKNIL